jgi:copper homeostasis protein CutC
MSPSSARPALSASLSEYGGVGGTTPVFGASHDQERSLGIPVAVSTRARDGALFRISSVISEWVSEGWG